MTFFVKKITLTQFRNYGAARLSVEDGINILIGANGAGKTNVLEAISLLSPGRGIRYAKLDDIKNKNASPAEYWAVSADLNTPSGEVKIGTGQKPDGKSGRAIRINGIDQSSQVTLGQMSASIWLVPQMDGLFLDSPGTRRRYLDRMVRTFDPQHSTHLNAYEKLLRERSHILKTQGERADQAWLDSLEVKIAENAVAIAGARLSYVDRLSHAVERLTMDETLFPKPVLSINGTIEAQLVEGSAQEAESYMRDTLKSSRAEDRYRGGATVGPHKSDLSVKHKALNMPAENCSTGEQKGLLVNMVLAEATLVTAERGFAPILLLDDIAAFLDDQRRHILFKAVQGLGAQCWMTGTDKDDFSALKDSAKYYSVHNGQITAN